MSRPGHRLGVLLALCRALGPGRDAWADTSLVRLFRPGPVSFDEVLDLAEESGVIEPLCAAMRPALGRVTPDAAARLRHAQVANTTRNLRMRAALTEAVCAMNDAGVVPLLLKGAQLLAEDAPRVLAERSMVDLDLVVSPREIASAGAALESIGYRADPGKPFQHPHELPYWRPGAPGLIELHPALGSPPIPAVLPGQDAWAASSPISFGAARACSLSPTHEVLHAILHSAAQDLNHAVAGLPLRHLHLLAELVRIRAGAIDWAEIQRAMGVHGLGGQLRDHLWLARRFAAMPRVGVVAEARAHERRVVVSYALGWPPHVRRNLRFAFGAAYLDSLYGHRGRPRALAVARVRHAVRLLSEDPRSALDETLERRG